MLEVVEKIGNGCTLREHLSCARGATIANFDDTIVAAVEKVMPSVINVSDVRLIQDAHLQAHPVQGVGSGMIIRQDAML